MHHIFLSPHYDDAVYSCGGTLASLTAAGESVTVLTICAGSPPTDQLSWFAEQLHERWGLSDPKAVETMIKIRRQEDQNALQLVGAQSHYLQVPDCIYRRGGERNRWLYAREETLFGKLNGLEDGLISDIARSLISFTNQISDDPDNEVRVISPLAIGNHVDHQLVRYAAERAFGAETLTFYQDFPYILNRDQIVTYEDSADWQSNIVYLDESAIDNKVAAITAYESQISTFWENKQALDKEVREFVRGWGNGEVYWSFYPSSLRQGYL
ncbi:MAG: PIG-L deacetylase family protein [Anaerolineae bacterium]